jgi:hypothetical protein
MDGEQTAGIWLQWRRGRFDGRIARGRFILSFLIGGKKTLRRQDFACYSYAQWRFGGTHRGDSR